MSTGGAGGAEFVSAWKDPRNGTELFIRSTKTSAEPERYYLGHSHYPGPLEVVRPEDGYLVLRPVEGRLIADVRIRAGTCSWVVGITSGAALFLALKWGVPVKLRDDVLGVLDGELPRVAFPPLPSPDKVSTGKGWTRTRKPDEDPNPGNTAA